MSNITAIAASATALALAAALVVPRGDPGPEVIPGAGTGATHVVAGDGSGDFTTITEAVAAAAEGDTVLVKPGTYAEALVIEKDITVQGDGPREEIVVTFPAGAGPNETDPDGNPFYATLKVEEADANLGGLTITGAAPDGDQFSVAVLVVGGAPQLQDLSIVTDAPADVFISLLFDQSAPVLQDSAWAGYLYSIGSSPTLEGNTISTVDAMLGLNGPAEVVVRGNTFLDGASISASDELTGLIEGNDFTDGGIGVDTGSDMLVRGNTFNGGARTPLGAGAILVSGTGSQARIVENKVTGSPVGVSITGGSKATVEANEFDDTNIAIAWSTMEAGTIDGNTITGGVSGIVVTGGSPAVVDNTVEGASARGISIGSLAAPSLSGNTVCGNASNLWLAEKAAPDIGENEICADEPAE